MPDTPGAVLGGLATPPPPLPAAGAHIQAAATSQVRDDAMRVPYPPVAGVRSGARELTTVSGRTGSIPPEQFESFGELLKYLRRRARLTQRELAAAVSYNYSHISRLENGLRAPDLATLRAVFLPALHLNPR